eukprot:SM000004S14974  [mRNA]  locus=s4:544352:547097:- [translate_table: standard]
MQPSLVCNPRKSPLSGQKHKSAAFAPSTAYNHTTQQACHCRGTLIFSFFLISVALGLALGLGFYIAALQSYQKAARQGDLCKTLHGGHRRVRTPAGSQARSAFSLEVDNRPALLAVVGVNTCLECYERRHALRRTWFPASRDDTNRFLQNNGLLFKFVIGKSKDKGVNDVILREAKQYNDIILLDHEDAYLDLPTKMLKFFNELHQQYNAEYYVKADDDIYLRPDRLATMLARDRENPKTYIGCFKKGQVIRDPKQKWYEPASWLLGQEYFLHAYGPIYALSQQVVESFLVLGEIGLRMLSNEDTTIGLWMLALNVTHEDDRRLCEPQCNGKSIAVWDIPFTSGLFEPEKALLRLHADPVCSQTPTIDDPDDHPDGMLVQRTTAGGRM